MRSLLVFIGSSMCMLVLSASVFATEDGTAAARRIVADLEVAWNAGDSEAYTAQFWPDAELVNIFGGIYEDRDALARRMDEMFAGAFKGSLVTSTIRRMRLYAPNLMVVDLTQDNTGTLDATGQRHPVQTRFKHILEKRDDVWRIVASQNTRVTPAPF